MTSEIKNYIQLAEGFQYSVNIAYDLNNDDKIKNFIPTNAAIEMIEDILLSTYPNSTDRARVLIGAYGKGKSHIILVLLSLLLRKDEVLFGDVIKKIKAYNEDLYNYIDRYINSDRKLLPVIIQGSSTSLSQAFLGSLEKALSTSGFEDFMPETHFTSAVNMIENWEQNYPDTYERFCKSLNQPTVDFKLKLQEYDPDAYEQFVGLYPSLTSGGSFNPFLGFDVVELYGKVIEKLKTSGYNGVFVVYDEFSKFLEAGITKVSSVDIKLLQDFAEKCNRSGENQMHLLLISHKDIANYIDKLPKAKVDGWKGVSERFKHVELHNNFSQVYEVISNVIGKDSKWFKRFCKQYDAKFLDMKDCMSNTRVFNEVEPDYLPTIIEGCYPLHPISTFILPRLSEKVAQNERTLFTFLSSANKNTLSAFLDMAEGEFPILTPDYIYDYFEQQFKKENYKTETYQIWQLTAKILDKIAGDALGTKIIKTIALIYIVGQFDKLPPTPDMIMNTFRETVASAKEINDAIDRLEHKQYVIYQRKTNHYLKLKNTTGIDIGAKIEEQTTRIRASKRVKDILTDFNFDSYMYPTSYNDNNDITRYFDFTFIESEEFFAVRNWDLKIEDSKADGVVFGIIVDDTEDAEKVTRHIESGTANSQRIIFVVPIRENDIDKYVYEYEAVLNLKALYADDDVMVEELNIYIEDLEDAINLFISGYTRPETKQSVYLHMGERRNIFRKAQISSLLSEICEATYTMTPLINNEAINKDELPTVAVNSRAKILAGLLANDLEPDLGLTGTGQEVSIMRSTIKNMELLIETGGKPNLLIDGIVNERMQAVITIISDFFRVTAANHRASIGELYGILTRPEHHIGLKKGVIPIYIALVLHFFKQHVVIMRGDREVEISPELLGSINENPGDFTAYMENWTQEKSVYIDRLETMFADNIQAKEKEYNTFNYIVRAMQRWFIALPKYAKEMKSEYRGGGSIKDILPEHIKFKNSLKVAEINARDYLFDRVIDIFGYRDFRGGVVDNIGAVKDMLDNAKANLIQNLAADVRILFQKGQPKAASLASVMKDWYEGLSNNAKNHLYNNGEERTLELIAAASNDETHFIERLAKTIVGLRIEDWEDSSIADFASGLKNFKQTVDAYSNTVFESEHEKNESYSLTFKDEAGNEITKTFERSKRGNRAKLLENDILATLDEFGQAVSESEKRQVLMDIIERMCR